MNTRALATQLIYAVLEEGHSLSEDLPYFKTQCKTEQDASFMQALVFGVLRWYPTLAFIANQLLERPIKKKDIELFYLALVGIYQLKDMQTPPHAAISETVEAARILNKSWATKLINAILRSYQRKVETVQQPMPHNEEAYYAHPHWLIESIRTAWPTEWKAILNANNQAPPLSLRINLQKTTRENYLTLLKEQGLEAALIPNTNAGITLKIPTNITTLPGFESGFFSVQDGAAQFAADLLQLSPNLRVLDACAAPGGKTTHLLETAPHLAEVVALDVSEQRVKMILDNLKRLDLNATVITADARHLDTWWDGKAFDRILLDAPCSATGVIRRHPDIKWLRTQKDMNNFVQRQLQLLQALWPVLKPGGILLYATCSIFPDENVHVLEKFLNTQKDAQVLPIMLPCGIAQKIGIQLLPGENNMDGFYYASIQKIED